MDRPIFLVNSTHSSITISFHPTFVQSLPPCISEREPAILEVEESTDYSQNILEDQPSMVVADLFSQVSLEEGEDDNDPLSQPFSQVSLEDRAAIQTNLEPVNKRIRLDPTTDVAANIKSLPKVRLKELICNLCGVIVVGGKSKLKRHKEKFMSKSA